MKRGLWILAGAILGVAITGVVAPLVIMLLPQAWRSERIVWATTAVIVASTVGASWFVSGRRKE